MRLFLCILSTLFFIHSCAPSENIHCNMNISIMDKDIYLKRLNWGVNGNSRLFVISTNNEKLKNINDYDMDKEYVFKGDIPIYIRTYEDTLIVYTYMMTKPPAIFESNIIVKQVEITNRENMLFIDNPSYININKLCEGDIPGQVP